MGIGENIRTFRKAKLLKQDELAKKAGISRVALGNYEREERIPSLEILDKIAIALETSAEILIHLNRLNFDEIYRLKIIDGEYIPLTSYQKSKIKESIEIYTSELEDINIDCIWEKYTDRAVMYILLDEYDKAIDDYTMAIELNNKYIQGYLDRSNLYNFIGLNNQALIDFNMAIELDRKQSIELKYKKNKSLLSNSKLNNFIKDVEHLIPKSISLHDKINLLNDDCINLISNLVDKLIQDKNNLR
ncbi:helix-turn-helix domain-containing protein [Clostridioides difficile]|nr:helix-turn-helix domain-containing protein [Clostridioides difficile]